MCTSVNVVLGQWKNFLINFLSTVAICNKLHIKATFVTDHGKYKEHKSVLGHFELFINSESVVLMCYTWKSDNIWRSCGHLNVGTQKKLKGEKDCVRFHLSLLLGVPIGLIYISFK